MSRRIVAAGLAGAACLLVLAGSPGAAYAGQGSQSAAAGRIYKWTDEKGVTHYGEAIPAEYRDQAAAEMSKTGVTVKRIDAVATPEQRRAADERARLEREEQKRLFEQRRRETALLNTYTSAREIEDARERSLLLPQQAIRGLQPRLKKAEDRLKSLQDQADAIQKSGKNVPEHLRDDVGDQKLEVESLRADIGRYQTQIEAIKTRFDADKARYIELTQVTTR